MFGSKHSFTEGPYYGDDVDLVVPTDYRFGKGTYPATEYIVYNINTPTVESQFEESAMNDECTHEYKQSGNCLPSRARH